MNRTKEILEEKGIKQTWFVEKPEKSICQTNASFCSHLQTSFVQLSDTAIILGMDLIKMIFLPKDEEKRNMLFMKYLEFIFD